MDLVFHAIDAGNSRIKIASFVDGELKKVAAFERDLLIHDREQVYEGALAAMAEVGTPTTGAVYACGRPAEEPLIEELAHRLAPHHEPQSLHAGVLLPFEIRYESGVPGPDRLANVLALRALRAERPACVIDVGTAINLEIIDQAGDFRGGAILPGPRLQMRSLIDATRGRLPETKLNEDKVRAVGNSTAGAIRAGIVLGIAGAVDRLLNGAEEELGAQMACVCTGGHAELILPYLRHRVEYIANLTLLGLREFRYALDGSART